MGKFGIGARVVDPDGDPGVIVGKEKGRRKVEYPEKFSEGFSLWWTKAELTPAQPVADTEAVPEKPRANECESAYIPTIGDRVRATAEEPAGEVGTVVGYDGWFDVAFEDWHEGHDGNARDGSDNHWFCEKAMLEPAQLQVEDGKYYRTRGGDIAGPTIKLDGQLVEADVRGVSRVFERDGGKHRYGIEGIDLIAEVRATQADSEPPTDSERKFKVGDRVRCVDNNGAPGIYKVGETYTVSSVDDAFEGQFLNCVGVASGMYAYRFEPAPFQSGDKVTVTGTVVDPPDAQGDVWVRFPSGGRYFRATDLRAA